MPIKEPEVHESLLFNYEAIVREILGKDFKKIPISDRKTLRTISGMQQFVLLYFNEGQYPNFRPFVFQDRNNMSGTVKERLLYAPNSGMEALHKIFVMNLRKIFKGVLESAHGGVSDSSPAKTLDTHRLDTGAFKQYWYILDLKDAYTQVKEDVLAQILFDANQKFFESKKETISFLQKYCMRKRSQGIFMGGNASPDLFNIYCEFLIDKKLRVFCQRHNITMTRYIDDIIFTSHHPIGRMMRREIRTTITNANLIVHPRKTHYYDLNKNPVRIMGLTVHLSGRVSTPRSYLMQVRGALHKAIVFKNAPTKQDQTPFNFRRIAGMVNTIRHLCKGRAVTKTEEKIIQEFENSFPDWRRWFAPSQKTPGANELPF